ncbi:hypothetical protein [Brevundimonas sp.]|uniref:hypothetical protein n=1 Tax=Brevundimonas sp. TaxID=1871086 RepID=UPI003563015E
MTVEFTTDTDVSTPTTGGVDWEHLTSSRPIAYQAAAVSVALELRRAVSACGASFSALHILAEAERYCSVAAIGYMAVANDSKPSASAAALQRLRLFRDWRDNWDAEGAPAPDLGALEVASNLLGFLKSYPVEPIAMLHASGLPMFVLNFTGGEGEITVSGDGAVDFVLDLPDGETQAEVELEFDNQSLPVQLHDVLTRLRAIAQHER